MVSLFVCAGKAGRIYDGPGRVYVPVPTLKAGFLRMMSWTNTTYKTPGMSQSPIEERSYEPMSKAAVSATS